MFVDLSIGRKKHRSMSSGIRSKSEPRYSLAHLQDQNLLAEQKRDLLKKILQLQRQKFKDNQARKYADDFLQSTNNFVESNGSNDNEQVDDTYVVQIMMLTSICANMTVPIVDLEVHMTVGMQHVQ
jgi:molecular chaperone GrpE (heat shock protein)